MKKKDISINVIMAGFVGLLFVAALIAYLVGINLYLIAVAVVASIYYSLNAYKQYVARVGRVNFLNSQLVSLNGVAEEVEGAIIQSEVYKKLVEKLEVSILDILADRIVSEHSRVLIRKKSQKIYADDYGREMADEWLAELAYFAKNIFMPSLEQEIIRRGINFEGINVDLDVQSKFAVEHWVYAIDLALTYKQDEQSENCPDFEVEFDLDDVVSGHDYEFFVSDLIRRAGWLATVTPGSGDHGADIIAELGGERVAVQCKYFSSPVGNKSVQEAYSAKGFYDCDHACVVTSSSFTPAAKRAAAKLGVSLLHHSEIDRYFQSV